MLPREKFSQRNISALTDADLIAIIFSTGVKGRDFMQLSTEALRKIKKLKHTEDIFPALLGIAGVGRVKAMKVVAGIELGRRLFGNKASEKQTIVNSKQAYELLKSIGSYKQEHLVAIYLNARYEVLLRKTVNIGTLDSLSVSSRDIIIPALECNCAYILIAHNHPSGDFRPSLEDIEMTQKLKEAIEIVGFQLLDHIIITREGWESVVIE